VPALDATSRASQWTRLVAVAFATVGAALAAAAAVTPVLDPDVWWVAAAGRRMLTEHAAPRQNLFSFVDGARPWVMHEWLFGPVYAAGLEHLGPSFFALAAWLVALAASALLVAGCVARARHPVAGWATALGALVFFGRRFVVARPTGVALLFPMALVLLVSGRRFGPRRALAATALEWTWANAHGSFPLGIAILGLGAIEGREGRRWRWLACAAGALATVANPYGLGLHRFVWQYFRGTEGIHREIHEHVAEFGTVVEAWGRTIGPLDAAGLLLALGLSLVALTRAGSRLRGAFCLLLVAAGAKHARHVELAGLVTALLLLPTIDSLVGTVRRAAPGSSPADGPSIPASRALLSLVPAALVGGVLFAAAGVLRGPEDWIVRGRALLPLLAAVPDGARLLAPFPQAGLAIWYGDPRGVRVFYDSRNDCYAADTYRAFRAAQGAETAPVSARRILDDTGTDAVLAPEGAPLLAALAPDGAWRTVRELGGFRLLLR
jgi:hypothetical protein